ncbi:MAG TPA: phosphoenolpyruvate--protein phosphotransferase [Pyrinomonadaceae bacterium]|nr:phosphoenolpyruvate--protein phosphotransferase [Pyrinomonadaceae bacterium]
MSGLDRTPDENANGRRSEVRFQAKSVSRGVANGRVVCIHGANRQYFRIDLPPDGVAPEIERLNAAFNSAQRRLAQLTRAESNRNVAASQSIFETHRLMLSDPGLQSKIEEAIRDENVNAEWAVKLVSDKYFARFKAIPDEHFRDRLVDLEDVVERILVGLGGGPRLSIRLEPGSIIAAKDLRPSTIIELHRQKPAALITEHGGWTSHTFILARELGIPAVTGLKKILRRLNTGDEAIVDGYTGEVFIHPAESTRAKYLRSGKPPSVELPRFPKFSSPVKTLDGRKVTLRANADLPDTYDRAKALGAEGIGLFRSEFLFNRYNGFPSERQQLVAYRRLAKACGDDGVKIRTFDIGAGQLLDRNEDRERNPALGLRAIRLGLSNREQLHTQIRSILRASTGLSVDIIIPMVTEIGELRQIRSIIAEERKALEECGRAFGTPRLGAMIEVPAAVMIVDELLHECDFLCLGTNDLVQYLLAVDRDNENVAGWFRTLHPAVLRAVKLVLDAAKRADKPVVVCGEMAGSPFYVPILIGLGATELSMNINSLSRIASVISSIAYEEAAELVRELWALPTVDEIETVVRARFTERWHHLYPEMTTARAA